MTGILGNSVSTDHAMLIASLPLKLSSQRRNKMPQRFAVERFVCDATRSKFQTLLLDKLSSIPREVVLDEAWEYTATHIKSAAEEVVGYSRPSHKPWISSATLELVEQRRACRNKERRRMLTLTLHPA